MADMVWLEDAKEHLAALEALGLDARRDGVRLRDMFIVDMRKLIAAMRLSKRGFENCHAAALHSPDEDSGEMRDCLKAVRLTAASTLTRLRSGDVEDA